MPLPFTYEALRGGSVASASAGLPVTATGAEKSTAILTASSRTYAASPPGESTPVAYAAIVVFIAMLCELPRCPPEPACQGRESSTASPALSSRPPPSSAPPPA